MGFCTCSHGCGKVAVPESTFTEHWGRREVSQYYSGSTRPANKKGRNMRAWGGGGAGCKSTLLKLWRALLLLHGRARTHTAAAAWMASCVSRTLSLSLIWLRHMTSDFLLLWQALSYPYMGHVNGASMQNVSFASFSFSLCVCVDYSYVRG
jgi:hypothetical protein